MSRFSLPLTLSLLSILSLLAVPVASQAQPRTADEPGAAAPSKRLSPICQAVKTARPGVVAIRNAEGRTTGAGIVFDGRGHIVTACHVIRNMPQKKIVIQTSTAGELVGRVILAEPDMDLAVVKVNPPRPLPACDFADNPELGETVVAIGHPFGYTYTVSAGIISGTGRTITIPATPGDVTLYNLLQTDAAINPGNSGGPLLNLDGQVVGIVLAIRNGGQNMAFAVPAEDVKRVLEKALPR